MYRKQSKSDQQEFVDFYLKFGGKLSPGNRWIRLTNLIPWDEFEQDYAAQFPSHTGNLAKSFRMALGALLIKDTTFHFPIV